MKRFIPTSQTFARARAGARALPGAATQRAENTITNIKTILLQITTFVVTTGLLFYISAFIYGSFYFAFVPPPIHSGPVHLVFEPCHENQGKCGYLNSSLSLSE